MNLKTIVYCLLEWKLLIATVVAFLLLIFNAEYQRGKSILYALMLQAKRYAKDYILKSGEEQEEYVVKKAMQFLPNSIKLFMSENTVRWLVKKLFIKLKDYADDGIINMSIKEARNKVV